MRNEERQAQRRIHFAQRTHDFLGKVQNDKLNDRSIKQKHFEEIKLKEIEDRKRFSTIRVEAREVIRKGIYDNFLSKKNIGGTMRSER